VYKKCRVAPTRTHARKNTMTLYGKSVVSHFNFRACWSEAAAGLSIAQSSRCFRIKNALHMYLCVRLYAHINCTQRTVVWRIREIRSFALSYTGYNRYNGVTRKVSPVRSRVHADTTHFLNNYNRNRPVGTLRSIRVLTEFSETKRNDSKSTRLACPCRTGRIALNRSRKFPLIVRHRPRSPPGSLHVRNKRIRVNPRG